MPMPKLSEVFCRYGAPMGRRNSMPPPSDDARRYYLQRVPFVDGDYDRGGAYWGAPANLWRAVSPCGEFECFVRANSRREACEAVREEFGADSIRFFQEWR